MIFVIGGEGFLGSAVVRQCEQAGHEYRIVEKHNYEHYIGRSCDIIINANGNSRKLLAREAPMEDFEMNVANVRRTLEDFRFQKYVLFSSADVYPDCSSPATTDEDLSLDPAKQSPYGFHKYLAELCVKHRASCWTILRLSGFVGPGIRKNAVYDVLNGGRVWVDPASEFQFLHTRDLGKIVLQLAQSKFTDGQIINLGAKGAISVAEIARMGGASLTVQPGSLRVRCEVALDRLAQFCEVPETQDAVREFVSETISIRRKA